jgi:hypothetical protein
MFLENVKVLLRALDWETETLSGYSPCVGHIRLHGVVGTNIVVRTIWFEK